MAELSVRSVAVRFGGVQALDDVDLQVAPGCVTGLIGPNGAGKTTLFNVITGLQRPTRGAVTLEGRDITSLAVHRRARLGIARTFQRLELFGTLSARENVQVALEVSRERMSKAARSPDDLLGLVRASQVADEPADLLPTGSARLVELARALATAPDVLLLDEPSAGLDENETAELASVLEGLASRGMAVLLVEHDMALVMGVCRRVAVLDHGVLIAEGEPDAIRNDPAVRSAYLGATETEEHGASGDEPARTKLNERKTAKESRAGESAQTSPVFELQNLRAGYGRIEVVHGVSLALKQGSVLALLGPNGAGKSTLLKVASGQLDPMAGHVLLDGADVTDLSSEQLARKGLSALPEGRSVFPNLTVSENLLMYSYSRRDLNLRDLEECAYTRFPALKDRRRQLAGRLSGGEQQALALARALCTGARVLLLDELSMGLAPMIVASLYETVGQLVSEHAVTLLLVEQFAKTALELADEAAIMVNGRIVRRGSPAEMEPELLRSYMGEAS